MAGIYEREFSISGSDPDESANIKISVSVISVCIKQYISL